jgi:hypothetical protein
MGILWIGKFIQESLKSALEERMSWMKREGEEDKVCCRSVSPMYWLGLALPPLLFSSNISKLDFFSLFYQ